MVRQFLQKEIDPAFARRARLILDNLELEPGMRVLDVGCGRGFYTTAIWLLSDGLKITGVDLNKTYLNQAEQTFKNLTHVRKNFKNPPSYKRADARRLPFEGQTFDRIICSEVLEHIEEDTQVIKEINRVLKQGGKAVFTVPNKNYPFLWDPLNWVLERLFNKHIPSHIWWLAGIWAGHVRLYTEEELVEKLRAGSLKVEKTWRVVRYSLPFAHFLLYGIGKNLVESGIADRSFDRFNFVHERMALTRFVSGLFNMIDRFNPLSVLPGNSFVNIVMLVKK